MTRSQAPFACYTNENAHYQITLKQVIQECLASQHFICETEFKKEFIERWR